MQTYPIYPTPTQPPQPTHWLSAEAEKSAIPLPLFRLNCRWAAGEELVQMACEEAVAQSQKGTSFVGVAAKRILDRYAFLESGGWVAQGDGEEIPYIKPFRPRRDEEGKLIKYETPAKLPARPLLPRISWEVGATIASKHGKGKAYQARRPAWQREQDWDSGFWDWVRETSLPIVVTEGLKKALSLCAHGYPAVALRGVTCWHPKGTNVLWEEIGALATPGRRFVIAFDADLKPKTVRAVGQQVSKLGAALRQAGCKVFVATWDPAEGKGVDDVLVAKGEAGQLWLDAILGTSYDLESWHKRDQKARLLQSWRYFESLGVEPERTTTGPYLPELPPIEPGDLYVVTAPTGTGKTTQLGKIKEQWVSAGGFVLVLSPLNTLGKQTSENWGLPHRHDCGNSREQQEAFRLLVYNARGVVACVDSLLRLQEFIDFCERTETPLLMMLDEVNQVLESLNLGGTLKDRQPEVLAAFARTVKVAASKGAIVLSEARVNRRSLAQIQTWSGLGTVRLFVHEAERASWDLSLLRGVQAGAVESLLWELVEGKRLILHVSSRHNGRRIEKLVHRLFPEKKTVRIDAGTNQGGNFDAFWHDPDRYLREGGIPDLLILSPSAKSGVSIVEPGFDAVYGLFSCHYPSMWMQQLARYRQPVRRVVWCPALVPAANAHEGFRSRKRVQWELRADVAGFAKVFGLELEEEDAELAAAQADFYAEVRASVGIEKLFPVEVLQELLRQEGHSDCEVEPVEASPWVKEALREAQEEVWREDAAALANAETGGLTVEEARERLKSSELTEESERQARKVLFRDEFPGIDFDDEETCYSALTERFGALRRGVLLQTDLFNLDAVKAVEADRVEAVLSASVRLPHRLPRRFLRAALLYHVGLIELLDGKPYTETDPRVQEVKQRALKLAPDLYRNFTLNCQPHQTGVAIVNKLLRKLGLKAEILRKVGGRGRQVKVWGIPGLCDPLRIKLLKSATKRIGGDVTKILETLPPEFEAARSCPNGISDPLRQDSVVRDGTGTTRSPP